jgi:TRAP-type C4-dicarboxylate transport system substrate-binding protein
MRRIDTPADLEGMKGRVPGGIVEMTMRRFKAVGVRMPGPEIHEALSRGTVDGAIIPYGPMLGYGIQARYATSAEAFGSVPAIFIVAEVRWRQLPEPVKAAMTRAGEAANRSLCEGIDGEEAENLEKIKQQGTTIVRWSAAQRSEAAALLASVGDEWAAAMDKRGKPGSKVLAAARQARGANR